MLKENEETKLFVALCLVACEEKLNADGSYRFSREEKSDGEAQLERSVGWTKSFCK